MRLGVISDIHGNLVALEAVLKDVEAAEPDLVWCLGDLAAFATRPAECIRRIQEAREAFGEKQFHVIGGNTDRYMVTGERPRTPAAPDEAALQGRAADWQSRDTALNWAVNQLRYDRKESRTNRKDKPPRTKNNL